MTTATISAPASSYFANVGAAARNLFSAVTAVDKSPVGSALLSALAMQREIGYGNSVTPAKVKRVHAIAKGI